MGSEESSVIDTLYSSLDIFFLTKGATRLRNLREKSIRSNKIENIAKALMDTVNEEAVCFLDLNIAELNIIFF